MSTLHPAIKELLNRDNTREQKQNELHHLEEGVNLVKDILNGKFGYCKLCDDYYFKKSFFTEQIIETERVCTYSDPINSGSDEYEDKDIRYTYLYCPKGHKTQINREEYWI